MTAAALMTAGGAAIAPPLRHARALLRVSTAKQEAQGVSLDQQRAAIEKYATENGYTIVAFYQDVMSGKRADRPEYQRMKADVRRGDTVLVYKLDRSNRNALESLQLWEDVERAGAGLVSVVEPYATRDKFVYTVLAGVAEKQSADTAQRVRDNMLHIVQAEGRWVAKPPTWYTLDMKPRLGKQARVFAPGEGRLIPNPGAREKAMACWGMFLGSRNLDATAAAFGLTSENLRRMMHNPAYMGDTVWGGAAIPDTHPALVTRETWTAAKGILDERKRNGKRKFRRDYAWLTGLVFVRDTPQRLFVQGTVARGNYHYATAISDRLRFGAERHAVNLETVHAAALANLCRLSLSPETAAAVQAELDNTAALDPYAAARHEVDRAARALDAERVNAARLVAQSVIDTATYAAMRAAHEAEAVALATRRTALPPAPSLVQRKTLVTAQINLAAHIEAAVECEAWGVLHGLAETFFERIEVWGAETAGLRGKAAHHWRTRSPLVRCVWNPAAASVRP